MNKCAASPIIVRAKFSDVSTPSHYKDNVSRAASCFSRTAAVVQLSPGLSQRVPDREFCEVKHMNTAQLVYVTLW